MYKATFQLQLRKGLDVITSFILLVESKYLSKAELPQFTHAENACILRTIDTYLQAVRANPRFISSNQGKNAAQ